jgi:valyl-tRNA synthetase
MPTQGLPERWIRSRMAATATAFHQAVKEYRFPEAALGVYHFLWDDLCDWYIELAKLPLTGDDAAARRSAQRALCDALDGALRLLHPMMPFVSEEIWQKLPRRPDDPRFLCIAPLPTDGTLGASRDAEADHEMDRSLKEVVSAIRNVRGECNVPPGKRIVAIVRTSQAALREQLATHRAAIQLLAQLSELRLETPGPKLPRTAAKLLPELEVLVPLEGLIDFDSEVGRLAKEIVKAQKDLETLAKKLDNPSFVERAPADVVAKDRERRIELAQRIEQLNGYRQVIAG